MNSETLAAYTGPVQINLSQMESQPQEGEVVPMPNQEASLINNHSQRKTVSLSCGVLLGKQPTFKGRPHAWQ